MNDNALGIKSKNYEKRISHSVGRKNTVIDMHPKKNSLINSGKNPIQRRSTINIDRIDQIAFPNSNYNDRTDEVVIQTYEDGKPKEMIVEIQTVSFLSMMSTFIHICNCIIRYTVLEIPKCFHYLGVFNACSFIILIGVMSIISVYFLLKAHQRTNDK